MCYYYGIIVKDSRANSHNTHTVHVVNIGPSIKEIDIETLQKFRTKWDCKFDWQLDPFELEQEMRLGLANRRHGPIPVVSFVLKSDKEIVDVKEPGIISETKLKNIFPEGTVVSELQRSRDDNSISFFSDSYRSIHRKLIAISA